MKIRIQTPAQHEVRLIAVPDEKVRGCACDIEQLQDDTGKLWDVLDYFEGFKSDKIWQHGLTALALGKPYDPDIIFRQYPNSEKVYFFIAKPS